jgi:hypothetical protein
MNDAAGDAMSEDIGNDMSGDDMGAEEFADLEVSDVETISSGMPSDGTTASVQLLVSVLNNGDIEATGITCDYEIVPQETTPWENREIVGDLFSSPMMLGAGANEEYSTNASISSDMAEFQEDFRAVAIVRCSTPDEDSSTTGDNELQSREFTMSF